MKRTLLITGGITIVLILIGVWAYILFTGTTSENISFNDFGFGNTTDPNVILPDNTIVEEDLSEEEGTPVRLHQLTTSPVAGFTEIVRGENTDPRLVQYIESGTGHIYSLNLETDEVNRISATTIPLATRGAITPNGQHVLMQSDTGSQSNFIIGTLSTTSDRMSNFELDEDIVSFTATDNNNFLYAVQGVGNLIVKQYRPITGVTDVLFTVPFIDATIAWNHSSVGPHVVYPKTTNQLEGYVYLYTNGVVSRVNATGYGLAAIGSDAGVLYTDTVRGSYQSFFLASDTINPEATPVTFMPEKCQFTRTSNDIALCGAGLDELPQQMPDSWYRGTYTSNDALWEYDTARGSAQLLVSPEIATGRQIDLINPVIGLDDSNLLFQNKVDSTLWLYEYITTNN